MARAIAPNKWNNKRFLRWLLEENRTEKEGFYKHRPHRTHAWWQVMCLTREVLRKAEKDPERRPGIHVGG